MTGPPVTGLVSTYEEAVAYLDAHIGRGMEPGLDRITALLDLMGNPEDSYPIIHIAGTNGKTSTSRMATLLLAALGLSAGTFVSPHLERVEERIGLNGTAATPEQFAEAVADVAAFAGVYEQRTDRRLTYFELTTAMAFAWFAGQAVDAAVIEVGLGGRLDATNAARGDVAVLTGVGIEHAEYLGDTVEAIAAEKLAIVDPGAVLVTGPLPSALDPLVARVARERAGATFRYGEDFEVVRAVRAVGGWQLDLSGVHAGYEDLYLPLHGRHQTVNLAVAVAAVEALIGRRLAPEAVAQAAAAVTVPGRMEPVSSSPLVLLDGAHNPSGFEALGAALAEEFPTTSWTLVLGVMEDKDLGLMLPAISPRVAHVVACRVDSPRAIPAERLAELAAGLVDVPVEAHPDPATAVERAIEVAGEEGSVLVAGSLYLVGAVRSALLGGGPPQRGER